MAMHSDGACDGGGCRSPLKFVERRAGAMKALVHGGGGKVHASCALASSTGGRNGGGGKLGIPTGGIGA